MLENSLKIAALHRQVGQFDHAEKIYRAILQEDPDHLTVVSQLAQTLEQQGRLDDAITFYRRATEQTPHDPVAHKNLGSVLCKAGLLDESFAAFRRHAKLAYSHGNGTAADHKTRHDREQRDYLASKNIHADFYLADTPRLKTRAVNPDVSAGALANTWQHQHPQMLVLDNLLSNDALRALQDYCWSSTIWQHVYSAGYLGAFSNHGIGSPLLAQIAEELRVTYPFMFRQHPLLQVWGFKYDSRMQGIDVHADFAAVNVNFWITPDEANNDPESGGLLVWDQPAPLSWDFKTYNKDAASIRQYLAHTQAKPTRIPYRCNRAVIFNANLFHETDKIAFKDGYLNRRINLTLLYGSREG